MSEPIGKPRLGSVVSANLAERAAYVPLGARVTLRNRGAFAAAREEVLRYGPDAEQRGLVWMPHAESARVAPVVVFVHGGSWASGAPETYRFVGRWFADAGYPVAVVGYRHVPAFRFPAQLEDVVTAASASSAALRDLGWCGDSAVVAGQSAGAHLAALATLSESHRTDLEVGLGGRIVAGVFISGPLDLALVCPEPRSCPTVQRLMGSDEGWDAADPLCLLGQADGAPMLAIHGARDPIVYAASSASFVAAAQLDGLDASLLLAEDAYHANLMGMFLGARPEGAALLEWMASRLEARPEVEV